MKKDIKLEVLPMPSRLEFSKNFRTEYLNYVKHPELLEQPILVTNLLFQIIADLRNNSFKNSNFVYDPKERESNQYKMDYWNEFLADEKNELRNIYKTSMFLKNKNKVKMTAALDFLKEFNKEQYTENKLTTSGGLIKDWYYSDNTGNFEIIISKYWATKIVSLDPYNSLDVKVMSSITSIKHRYFLMYLMELKKYQGTSKKFQDLMDAYGLKYDNIYELMRGFLAPLKNKLDNKLINENWISFNYFLDPNKHNSIKLVPFDVKPSKEMPNGISFDVTENDKSYQKNIITYKTKYVKRRHQLSAVNATFFKDNYIKNNVDTFEIDYKLFLAKIKKEKLIATDLLDDLFMEKWKEYIESKAPLHP